MFLVLELSTFLEDEGDISLYITPLDGIMYTTCKHCVLKRCDDGNATFIIMVASVFER